MKKSIEVKREESIVITIHQKIVNLKNEIGHKFYELGAYLKQVRDNRLYQDMGCETFEIYIGQPELSLKRSMVYSLIGVYEDFIESGLSKTLDIEGVDYYKLDRVRQFKNNQDFEEWVLKAKELSLSDLNEEIRLAKGGEEYEPKEPEYRDVHCPLCGGDFRIKI